MNKDDSDKESDKDSEGNYKEKMPENFESFLQKGNKKVNLK